MTESGSSKRLEGRRAIVTGAASGIGRAVARRFAADGASVAAFDRNDRGLAETVRLVAADGGLCHSFVVDLSNENAVQQAVAASVEKLGTIDTLAAVAGIELASRGDNRVHLLGLAEWQQTIGSNLTGMFLTLKYSVGAMLAAGAGGSVIVAGSPCGLRGFCTAQHAYSASKAGVHGLVRPMAVDYAADGIRVNCVIPGFIDTPLTAELIADPVRTAEVAGRIPARRPGTPAEVAGLFSWLASAEASYVTGAFFAADGGQLAV